MEEEKAKVNKKSVVLFWMITIGFGVLFALVQLGKEEGKRIEQIESAGGVGDTLPELGQIGDFSFLDQTGKSISQTDLNGKIWVFNLMFARCQGPCPMMTHNISRLHKMFGGESKFRLVSLTTDPDYDTSEVLYEYATKYRVNHDTWYFLRGPMASIVAFATKQMKIPADTAADLHSTKAVLVDQGGKIRGFYDSLESAQMELLRTHIKLLLSSSSTI